MGTSAFEYLAVRLSPDSLPARERIPMSKPKTLLQLDPDAQASVFDAVVAVDSGVDQLFRHSLVRPEQVRDLVYGCIFTRGPEDLRSTAIFVGGADVAAGEALFEKVRQTFFGPMRVSVMLDSNGANTTAAAAVLAAARHVPLAGAQATVLAATGPVGSRVVQLLASQGATVRVMSRSVERAQATCQAVVAKIPHAKLTPSAANDSASQAAAVAGTQIVIAAGAPGVELLPVDARKAASSLVVAIDLSAVPPPGIAGVKVADRGETRDGVICYGAVGVGGTKMKIHKAALRQLFEANDQLLDAAEIFAIGQKLAT